MRVADIVQGQELLGLALGCGEIDASRVGAGASGDGGQFANHLVSLVDARFGLGGASFRTATQPFDFRVNAIFQGFLAVALGVQIQFLSFQKRTVVAGDTEGAVFEDAIQLHDSVGYVLQEIAVVADDHAGEGSSDEHRFEPIDARQIQVIGRLIE